MSHRGHEVASAVFMHAFPPLNRRVRLDGETIDGKYSTVSP